MSHKLKLLSIILLSCVAGCSDSAVVYVELDDSPEQSQEKTCKDACKANTKSCIDDETASICTKNKDDCLAYKTISCPENYTCNDGTCIDEQGNQPCENECNPDETSCLSEKKLQTCFIGDDGCYKIQNVSCTNGKTCLKGKCVAENPDECENQCTPDETECLSNNQLKTCVLNENGCYEFETVDCESGTVCSKGECKKSEENCQNECQPGSKSCTQDGKTMVCDDYNGDGCLEILIAPCNTNEHCNNGICEDNTTEPDPCTNECSQSGLTECDGTSSVKTCGNYDDDSCLEWSVATSCKSGTTCKSGKCDCTNQCDTNGKTECDSSSNGFKTCTDTNGDGCYEWSSVTPCNDMACKSGACVCNHACEANAKECSGSGYRSCTTNAQGCRVWSSVTPCSNGCDKGACKPDVVMKPTRYPGNQILSPVTEYSVQQMKNIAAKKSRSNVHFAKLGDSHFAPGTVFMYCFASNQTHNLNGATSLENSISAFQSKSPNSFSRDSVSAVIGWTVNKALTTGKLSEELSAMNPRFAFIDYGSNDIGWFGYSRPTGTSNEGFFYTLQWFYREYRKALDLMIPTGVIPLILGTGYQNVYKYSGTTLNYLNPFYFVPVFNAVSRGLAEQYQVPFLDLAYLQMQEPLKSNNYGLSTDNLHHTSGDGGCNFTDSNMKYGANARNRYALEMLDRAYRTVVQSEKAPDAPVVYEGSGTKTAPYIISNLPYTHAGNTSKGTNNISTYTACETTSEAGPEIYYQLKLTKAQKIRAFAVSAQGVDADIHMLKSLDGSGCLARGDKWVEGNLDAGTYYFVVDTYSSSNNAGEYLFGIVECLAGDGLCGTKNTGG